MTSIQRSQSPSPPPVAPSTDTTVETSYRYVALRKVYTSALRATLTTNSYRNFASCFPTPAQYCPRALEGVWKQLNTRLEEECVKDFDKLCNERDVEKGLASWERLLEDAKARKAQHMEENGSNSDVNQENDVKPMHLLSSDELHAAHLAPTMSKAEQELQGKLGNMQKSNQEVADKIAEQRAEMQRLVEQLEKMVEDVEEAAQAVENDEMKDDLRQGHTAQYLAQDDAKMSGT